MQQVDADLWTAESPLRFLGLEVGARMTVIRLPAGAGEGQGDLFLHSPIAATPDLVREVQALGRVAWLVAPNKFHHLYVGDWHEACPEARLYVAPGLDTKRSDLNVTGVLTDDPEPAWADTIDQVALEGFPFMNEIVFYHRPTATLMVSDLAFNMGPDAPALTRAAFRLIGTEGKLAPTLLEKLLVKDRKAFRRSLERILEWPFERVIVAHGDIKEANARTELVEGYAWILE